MTESQEQLQKTLDKYSLLLDTSGKYTPFFQIEDFNESSRELFISDTEYEIVLAERAKPYLRKKFSDINELLYWLTTEAIKKIVSQNREKDRKGKSLSEYLKNVYQQQKELMHMINDEWAERFYLERLEYGKRVMKISD